MPVDLLTRRSHCHLKFSDAPFRLFSRYQTVPRRSAFAINAMEDQNITRGSLMRIGSLWKEYRFFYNDCCEPKHKFSRGKVICITGSSSPWGGGESWCLVASAVFSPAGVKWVAKLELREEKQKGEKGSEEQPCSVYIHGNLHPDRSQILSRHYQSPQIMPLPVRTRPADL